MDFQRMKTIIVKMPEKTILMARKLHAETFVTLSFNTFLKYLERLAIQGFLKKIGKGVYCRPITTPFGLIGVSEKDIEEYFTSNNQTGMLIGYKLYNKYNLTTQIPKVSRVYSNIIEEKVRNIGSVEIIRLDYDKKLMLPLECLEILENYSSIQDINKRSFLEFCKHIADTYDENLMLVAYNIGKYKKRTLAFLKAILDFFNIPNQIAANLNFSSKYSYPSMEKLANEF